MGYGVGLLAEVYLWSYLFTNVFGEPMRISEIVMEVINRLVSEEELRRLAELGNEEGEKREIPIPDNFPKEIENPIIGDLYNDQLNDDGNNILILGSYTPMKSPGVITFYMDAITKYTGSLIKKIVKSGYPYNFESIILISYLVVKDITLHESFHYYCDYKRSITLSKYDRDKEEALAVAHSYNMIRRQFGILGYTNSLANEFRLILRNYEKRFNIRHRYSLGIREYTEVFKEKHYKSFTLKGYRDWHKYINRNSYETDFYEYIKDSQLDKLLSNGVPVNDIRGELMIIGHRGTKIVVK